MIGSNCLLAVTCLVGLVTARPSPDPKVLHWSQNRPRAIPRSVVNSVLGRRATNGSTPTCSETKAQPITAKKQNIWSGLTTEEAVSVVDWLFSQPSLNLTTSEEAGAWDNTIMLVELQPPNKTDAVAYLDTCGGKPPPRYAHVVLNNRATEEAHYADLLVGPLPLVNGTAAYQPLDYIRTRQDGGKVRNIGADDDEITAWAASQCAAISDITNDLWGLQFVGQDNDTMFAWAVDPYWQDNGQIVAWFGLWRAPTEGFDSSTLLPMGLYFAGEFTGRDPSKWNALGWFYMDQYFETTEAFRDAYWGGQLEKLPANTDGSWAHTDPAGDPLKYETNYPPVAVAPSGTRFEVDYDQQYVEWMDFSFYIGFNRDTGMTLHDIRYNGKRIVYEAGLQEALAHYASGDPYQSGTSYLDTFYGFGPFNFQLVPGYDCPEYATFLNSSFYVAEETRYHPDSICLFEWSADYPMQRHSTSDYVSNSKNTYLNVRSVSTIGNYDYMFTYSFYMDGSFNIEVRASGYIQSASYSNGPDFGYKIGEALSGSMHDHVLNFKVDMDILGTGNSVETVDVAPVSREFPWSFGKPRNTMQLVRSYIDNEDDARFDWSPNSARQLLVVNKDEKNQWGEYRGYRVAPLTGPAHLTVKDSSNLANAARWADYDVQITQQKDTELRAAHAYNSQDVNDPPINFDKFFNSESLDQEDLVFWLNLGMHHVPHTGDLPNTVFTHAHAGVSFSPSNYFDTDISRRSRNAVRINYGEGKVAEVETFGQKAQACQAEFTPVEHDLWQYKGDVVVRKFPYDPNNWWFETDVA